MSRLQKEERLHFRVTGHQKNIIAQAAKLRGVTMTDFILEATYQAATHLLLDQTSRQVPADKWAAVEAALAAPAQEISALREMANKYGRLIGSAPQPVRAAERAGSPEKYAGRFSDMPVAPDSIESKGADFQSASSFTTVKKKQLAIA